MTPFRALALDLGASSGRALRGTFDGARVTLDEVYRFPNGPVERDGTLRWDIAHILREARAGVAAALADGPLDSLGVDSWGVDYGLLDTDGRLVDEPFCYRDRRALAQLERVSELVPPQELYRVTGIQTLPINTLYQLLADQASGRLDGAARFLPLADLVTHDLTGTSIAEYTLASTSQLLDLGTRGWSETLIDRLGLPREIFPPLIQPGPVIGPLRGMPGSARSGVPVVAVTAHDTAAAVVAVPAADRHFAYISCGTWSIVGVELPGPVVTDAARLENCSNEGGFGGSIRFLKNVAGMWLLEECRRAWSNRHGWDELLALADAALPFGPLIDPDDPGFLAPGDMPERIRAYCRRTGQPPPGDVGPMVRCVLESLALAFRQVIDQARRLSGLRVDVVHIVGGGSRNGLLCRLTADATGLPVVAGPAESTGLGNLLVQAHARELLAGLPEMRAVARRSAAPREYSPHPSAAWDDAAARFAVLRAGGEDGPSQQ